MKTYDFVIVGAGIVGMTVARELKLRHPKSQILILEKEPHPGLHASGRNSGVVHAGIYYPPGTLKARYCVEGHKLMLQYVTEHKLPHEICGKVIVAPTAKDVPTLQMLIERAEANGAKVQKLSLAELREVEPSAHSVEWALWSPRTAILDSQAVLLHLEQELRKAGVEFVFNQNITALSDSEQTARSANETYSYGYLINASGVHCERLAHACGVGLKYRVLPFKGSYWKAAPSVAARLRGLIYPVPDLNVPFLGVHVTKTMAGTATFGPSAMPAFGRENYTGLSGIDWAESAQIAWRLTSLWLRNPNGFRRYVYEELRRLLPGPFFREANGLLGDLRPEEIEGFYKVGIRPQLLDLEKGALEMDFVMETGAHSLHILNAISPAFTCSFAFARHVADQL